MVPVALGIPLDHATRRFYNPAASYHTRRALMETVRRILRSHGTLHRRSYRIREHRLRQRKWGGP